MYVLKMICPVFDLQLLQIQQRGLHYKPRRKCKVNLNSEKV